MATCSTPSFTTVGEIAARFNKPLHKVTYAIESRKIRASGAAGRYRVFDEAAVAEIGQALAEIDARMTPPARPSL